MRSTSRIGAPRRREGPTGSGSCGRCSVPAAGVTCRAGQHPCSGVVPSAIAPRGVSARARQLRLMEPSGQHPQGALQVKMAWKGASVVAVGMARGAWSRRSLGGLPKGSANESVAGPEQDCARCPVRASARRQTRHQSPQCLAHFHSLPPHSGRDPGCGLRGQLAAARCARAGSGSPPSIHCGSRRRESDRLRRGRGLPRDLRRVTPGR